MDPFTPRLSAGHFRPEAYTAPDVPPRSTGAGPSPGSAREVDRDRRPSQPAYGETAIELGFADLLDVINPLQHIPVVGDLYRALTGDQITGPARIAGGAIFGGPLGFVSGIVNAISADATGQNIGETMVAAIFGDGEAGPDPAQALASTTVAEVVPQVVAAVPAPTLATQAQLPLTGAAALQALGADLRVAQQGPEPVPPATLTSAAIDARQLVPAPQTAFTNRMIEGLNKYKALATEKNAPSAPPAPPVDRVL